MLIIEGKSYELVKRESVILNGFRVVWGIEITSYKNFVILFTICQKGCETFKPCLNIYVWWTITNIKQAFRILCFEFSSNNFHVSLIFQSNSVVL